MYGMQGYNEAGTIIFVDYMPIYYMQGGVRKQFKFVFVRFLFKKLFVVRMVEK